MDAQESTARRMRVLRRDGYRCHRRTGVGAPCGRPAAFVARIDPSGGRDIDNLHAVCREHRGD